MAIQKFVYECDMNCFGSEIMGKMVSGAKLRKTESSWTWHG